MASMFKYGNCSDCGDYAKLNERSRCRLCVEEETAQINTAKELAQLKPTITLEEIAHALDVEENRVMEWVRKGHVRCIVVEFDCPRCHTHVQNRLSCPKCGYQDSKLTGKEEPVGLQDFSSRMVTVERRKPARGHSGVLKTKVLA